MHNYSPVRVGVAGATGYAGLELLRRLARHPHADVRYAPWRRARRNRSGCPRWRSIWDAPVEPLDVDKLGDAKRTPCSSRLPDTLAAELAPALVDRGTRVFDLSGAFRLRDVGAAAAVVSAFAVDVGAGGLRPDRAASAGARERAARRVPGLLPDGGGARAAAARRGGLLEPGIIIDAKSGISGAGKTPTERTHFSECHGSISAYGVFAHRHAAEIEQELGTCVTFVPHLVPLDRGIFETIYARLRPGVDDGSAVAAALAGAYASSPFVRLTGGDLPEIKHVAHTNFCDIGWRVDTRAVSS